MTDIIIETYVYDLPNNKKMIHPFYVPFYDPYETLYDPYGYKIKRGNYEKFMKRIDISSYKFDIYMVGRNNIQNHMYVLNSKIPITITIDGITFNNAIDFLQHIQYSIRFRRFTSSL